MNKERKKNKTGVKGGIFFLHGPRIHSFLVMLGPQIL